MLHYMYSHCMCVYNCIFVCVQVVVESNATFQDVRSEILRVYQGISLTSADER